MGRAQSNRYQPLAIGDSRRQGTRPKRQYYLIVCEGIQTEPNYFRALTGDLVGGQADRVVVVGAADNTLNLISCAEAEIRRRKEDMLPAFRQIWLVFDRDSFPPDDFDNTIHAVMQREGWHAAWSNEAFELWYLYHFKDECGGSIGRERFKVMLSACLGKKYEKNSRDMYRILKTLTPQAIVRAHRAAQKWSVETPYHQRNPATSVWELVEGLIQYS